MDVSGRRQDFFLNFLTLDAPQIAASADTKASISQTVSTEQITERELALICQRVRQIENIDKYKLIFLYIFIRVH